MRNRIQLVRPALEYRDKASAFKQAFFDAGEDTIDGSERLDRIPSYEEWLAYVTDNASEKTVRENCVLSDTYFVFNDENRMIGITVLRHELNDFFRDFGHCGYSVLPGERRKGYATEILSMILEKAKLAGLRELQLSALHSNVGSIRTIQKNGGVFIRNFDYQGKTADVFMIKLA